MKKKDKIIPYTIFITIFCILGGLFLIKYIASEKKQYVLYQDFSRGSIVMTLSTNSFDVKYSTIRSIQSSNKDIKETEGSLIYDFSQYNIVPILSYLKNDTISDELAETFNNFSQFSMYYYSVLYSTSEDVFEQLDNNVYYKYNNGIYTYKTKLDVITANFYQNEYDDYLKTINEKSVQSNLIDQLYKNSIIKSLYSYNELVSYIKNDYSDFYTDHSDIIINAINTDLQRYTDYLIDKYFIIEDNKDIVMKTGMSIETKTIELTYNFTKLARIYNQYSKYYKYSYQLDINYLWEQLEKLGYPKLYS